MATQPRFNRFVFERTCQQSTGLGRETSYKTPDFGVASRIGVFSMAFDGIDADETHSVCLLLTHFYQIWGEKYY